MSSGCDAVRRWPDYTIVAETPDGRAGSDQRQMLLSRYELARSFCPGGDVLEAACGSGIGLGYLARRARSVAGGDIDQRLCATAAATYRSNPRVRVGRMDAQQLPFADGAFDEVILLEALYYLADPDAFFREARRVLRPGGKLVISTANSSWEGFNPSPLSRKYFTAAELRDCMQSHGFETSILAGFPESREGWRAILAGTVRRAAVRLGMIPKTMRGKEWLKRIFYGPLEPLPRELPEDFAEVRRLIEIRSYDATSQFRILYAVGHRQ